jgi:hypothetical protein
MPPSLKTIELLDPQIIAGAYRFWVGIINLMVLFIPGNISREPMFKGPDEESSRIV